MLKKQKLKIGSILLAVTTFRIYGWGKINFKKLITKTKGEKK